MTSCTYAKLTPNMSLDMSPDNDTLNTSQRDGGKISATPAGDELKRRLGVAPTPRRLTLSEIALLRQSAKEASEVAHEVLSGRISRRNETHDI